MPTVAPTCCRRHRGQERYEYLSVNLGNIGSPPPPPTPIFSNAQGWGGLQEQESVLYLPSRIAVELPTVRKQGAARLRDSGLPWTTGRSDFAESIQLSNVEPAAGVRVHRASLRLYLKRRSYAPLTLNSQCMCCVGSGEAQEFGGCGGLGRVAEGVKTHRTTCWIACTRASHVLPFSLP